MFNTKMDSKLRIATTHATLKSYTASKLTISSDQGSTYIQWKERVVQIRGTSNYYEQTDSFVHVLCVFIVISICLELAGAIMCIS